MKSASVALLALSILGAVMVTPIHATYSFQVYTRTDKPSYLPGDSGTLYITVKNMGSQSFTVKNVSIAYPWMAFITDHWDGNFTTLNINAPVGTPGGVWNTQYTFTVPSDSRVYQNGEQVSITLGTDIPNEFQGLYSTHGTIAVANAAYIPLSLTSSLLPIIEIVVLAIAVVMLALVYFGIRKLSKK